MERNFHLTREPGVKTRLACEHSDGIVHTILRISRRKRVCSNKRVKHLSFGIRRGDRAIIAIQLLLSRATGENLRLKSVRSFPSVPSGCVEKRLRSIAASLPENAADSNSNIGSIRWLSSRGIGHVTHIVTGNDCCHFYEMNVS